MTNYPVLISFITSFEDSIGYSFTFYIVLSLIYCFDGQKIFLLFFYRHNEKLKKTAVELTIFK